MLRRRVRKALAWAVRQRYQVRRPNRSDLAREDPDRRHVPPGASVPLRPGAV